MSATIEFQHTAARRRLVGSRRARNSSHGFQHTAARRRLDGLTARPVSTSSRFNTQPPEGGWGNRVGTGRQERCFNTQPPEGGWQGLPLQKCLSMLFQHTAARRRLAQSYKIVSKLSSFNTQPPEGGWRRLNILRRRRRRFNTQPPEGGWKGLVSKHIHVDSFNTQPPEGGWLVNGRQPHRLWSFNTQPPEGGWLRFKFAHDITVVSTHSRPKAAGY